MQISYTFVHIHKMAYKNSRYQEKKLSDMDKQANHYHLLIKGANLRRCLQFL